MASLAGDLAIHLASVVGHTARSLSRGAVVDDGFHALVGFKARLKVLLLFREE